jgi:hypothetical protein
MVSGVLSMPRERQCSCADRSAHAGDLTGDVYQRLGACSARFTRCRRSLRLYGMFCPWKCSCSRKLFRLCTPYSRWLHMPFRRVVSPPPAKMRPITLQRKIVLSHPPPTTPIVGEITTSSLSTVMIPPEPLPAQSIPAVHHGAAQVPSLR